MRKRNKREGGRDCGEYQRCSLEVKEVKPSERHMDLCISYHFTPSITALKMSGIRMTAQDIEK